jgi:hypothetical protein
MARYDAVTVNSGWRYFGELSVEGTAEVLGVAPITAEQGKAWLDRELAKTAAGEKGQ